VVVVVVVVVLLLSSVRLAKAISKEEMTCAPRLLRLV
jgi:hypothetical protein